MQSLPKFSRLIRKSGLDAPKGTGFYSLRRTAATFAARSGDPFAVQRLLGHADLQMATRYVQDVSAQTDRVIENSRRHIIEETLGTGSNEKQKQFLKERKSTVR